MIALPVGENRMIVASFVSTKHRNVTEDGQTDGQTNRQLMAYTAVRIASYADCCNDVLIYHQSKELFTVHVIPSSHMAVD